MRDSFDREIDYIRISVTDRCNLRCRYCMPAEGIQTIPMSEILTYEEIARVCRTGVKLGIRKIRLTGGEPLARAQVPKLVSMLGSIPGIESITMTTNGILLGKYLSELKDSGLAGVNISLDTMNRELFQKITRSDALPEVMKNIQAALDAGLKVKVNTVLLPRDFFEDCVADWREMLSLAERFPIDLRFIELMPIGEGKQYYHVTGEEVLSSLRSMFPGMQKDSAVHGSGPATYYRIPGFAGSVGLILAMHGKFCHNCNRIRLSATGQIKPCLCYAETYDLRKVLRSGGSDEEIRKTLEKAVFAKPAAHCFDLLKNVSEEHRMVSIGG